MPPIEPNDEERREELPQDNGTPFRPAVPPMDDTGAVDAADTTVPPDDTQPATDTGIDSQELYDEGVSSAAETPESSDSAVTNEITNEQAQDDDLEESTEA